MALTLWLVWCGIRKNLLFPIITASICAGLGAMTRVEGFILWGALAIFTIFQRVSRISLKRRIIIVSFFVLLFPLLLSTFLFFIKWHSSQIAFREMALFSTNAIKENIRAILQPEDPINEIGQNTYNLLPSISRHSLEMARRHRVVLAISEVIYKFIKSSNLLIILFLLGLWKRKKEGFESSDWYLLYTFAVLFGMCVFYSRQTYYLSARHGLTLVLPSLYFSGHGLAFITETFSRYIDRFSSRWGMLKRYLLPILTSFLIIIFLADSLSGKGTDKTIYKKVGLWLKENGYQGSVMMGSNKFLRLIFYADGKFIEMPASWPSLVCSIQNNKVQVIIVDSCTIDQDCPDFSQNWSRKGLFPLKESKEKGGKCSIQIYGVNEKSWKQKQ
jgi:hypothetical protein